MTGDRFLSHNKRLRNVALCRDSAKVLLHEKYNAKEQKRDISMEQETKIPTVLFFAVQSNLMVEQERDRSKAFT